MVQRTFIFLCALFFAGQATALAETVREHPDERLGANVAGVVAVINDGDPARLEQFVTERYGANMLEGMPPPR